MLFLKKSLENRIWKMLTVQKQKYIGSRNSFVLIIALKNRNQTKTKQNKNNSTHAGNISFLGLGKALKLNICDFSDHSGWLVSRL